MTDTINGIQFLSMVHLGSENLQKNVERINTLNVFPVPDGDTGTNMNLTFTCGLKEATLKKSEALFEVSDGLSKGLLMGARGNSGVILSQLFRGFASYAKNKSSLTTIEFAQALKNGVDMAYKAVMRPIEGTILTVARETALFALEVAQKEQAFVPFMEQMLVASKESLKRTPELLPVLKEVNVVDSGGQGLVCVYEGFLSALKGEKPPELPLNFEIENKEQHIHDEVALLMKEGVLSEQNINFGYCTEFMIRLNGNSFDEQLLREKFSQHGDSLLVISDNEIVKVHIHAEDLGSVFSLAQKNGELFNVKIENMRDQFRNRISSSESLKPKDLGFVAVSMGEGFANILTDLGVDAVLEGGQTMNPSTEDLVKAIKQTNAKRVFVFPNNGNIILAAEQASQMLETEVFVVPTKNIVQCIQSLLMLNRSVSFEEMKEQLMELFPTVEYGLVTKAVRNTTIGELAIQEGEYIGMVNGKISVCYDNLEESLLELIRNIITSDHSLISLYYGEDMAEEYAQLIATSVSKTFGELEVEVLRGGQPLYPFVIGIE